MIFDLLRGFARIGVVPGSVFIRLPIDEDVVVTRLTLPMTRRMCFASAEVFSFYRVRWEIVITFNNSSLSAIGKGGAVPYRFHQTPPKIYFNFFLGFGCWNFLPTFEPGFRIRSTFPRSDDLRMSWFIHMHRRGEARYGFRGSGKRMPRCAFDFW